MYVVFFPTTEKARYFSKPKAFEGEIISFRQLVIKFAVN